MERSDETSPEVLAAWVRVSLAAAPRVPWRLWPEAFGARAPARL